MIDALIIFGLGIVLGAFIMLTIIVLMLTHHTKPKKPITKDEWKMT